MQDELVALMSRNMHLSAIQPSAQDMSTPSTPQVIPQAAPITYITQHYHHSSHIASMQVQEIQASTVLEEAGVNASALLPSQLQLFKNAAPDQQQRLVELWRISPPTFGNQMPSRYMSNWPQTSMEIEEEAAQERWTKQEQERLKNLSVLPSQMAEPYMAQGYDSLPNINGVTAPSEFAGNPPKATDYRQSNDPAYQGREWWNLTDAERMEHQYGMIQQMQMGYDNSYGSQRDVDQEMR